MRCESVNQKLADYVDGRCGPITRGRIRRHLSGCEACAEARKDDEHLNVLLETWSDEQPSPSVWLGIREAIDLTPSYVPETPLVPWWARLRLAMVRSFLPYTLGAVTTALLVMAGLGRTIPPETPAPPQVGPPASAVSADDRIVYADGYAPMDRSDGAGGDVARSALRPDEVPLVVERQGDAILIRRNAEDLIPILEALRRGGLRVHPAEPPAGVQRAGFEEETH